MAEGSSVQTHVLKMIEWIERLEGLGFPLDKELSTDLILQSHPDSYSQFIVNFTMNKIEVSLAEMLNMLKTTEGNLKKEKPTVLMVGKSNKKRRAVQAFKKGNAKKQSKQKQKKDISKGEEKGECFHCKKRGTGKEIARTILQ